MGSSSLKSFPSVYALNTNNIPLYAEYAYARDNIDTYVGRMDEFVQKIDWFENRYPEITEFAKQFDTKNLEQSEELSGPDYSCFESESPITSLGPNGEIMSAPGVSELNREVNDIQHNYNNPDVGDDNENR